MDILWDLPFKYDLNQFKKEQYLKRSALSEAFVVQSRCQRQRSNPIIIVKMLLVHIHE